METNQQNQDEIEIEWNFDDIFSFTGIAPRALQQNRLCDFSSTGTWPSDGTGQQSIYEAAV